MKMNVHVTIEGSKLDEAMDKVAESMCVGWFSGDREAYEEWAGDRVWDALWTFLHTLEDSCHIQIDHCEDKYFDSVFGD